MQSSSGGGVHSGNDGASKQGSQSISRQLGGHEHTGDSHPSASGFSSQGPIGSYGLGIKPGSGSGSGSDLG